MFVRLTEVTNRTFVLPLVVFYPTSQCNSRCLSCDWWKRSGESDLTLDEIESVAAELPALGTKLVVFSGGEPLLRPEVFDAARLFRARGLALHLLTSGVLLERFAPQVSALFSRVVVSLDATSDVLYHHVRGVAALTTVEHGIARLRSLAPGIPVTARSTLHRANFRELPALIDRARALGLDGISFLPADVSSSAFGREHVPDASRLMLAGDDIAELEALVERTVADHAGDFASGFVAESPEKLRRLPRYYAALAGQGDFPPVRCNAPFVSVVVEADGSVRPCFFHEPIGNVRRAPLGQIVAHDLPAFRHSLDMSTHPTCRRCVCSMSAGWRRAPWQ